MGTRIGLFLLTNAAVLVVLTTFLYILESFFGISIGSGVYGVLAISALFGFGGSYISLLMSRWSAKRAYKIKPVQSDEVSMLSSKERLVYDTVQSLAETHNIDMPEVGFYQANEPNAFATGSSKNKSLVAVSSGLLDSMDNGAIEGVVAHEMAHVLNGDMVTMTLLQGIVNTFVFFGARLIANIVSGFVDEKMASMVRFAVDIAFQLVFGFLASTITMKFSRYREFKADAGSAHYVGKEKMIAGLKALQIMQAKMQPIKADKYATMKISTGNEGGFKALFASHPPLEVRIKALEDLVIR